MYVCMCLETALKKFFYIIKLKYKYKTDKHSDYNKNGSIYIIRVYYKLYK
jgi:hypothetical protein